jgi:hypothetical protein
LAIDVRAVGQIHDRSQLVGIDPREEGICRSAEREKHDRDDRGVGGRDAEDYAVNL